MNVFEKRLTLPVTSRELFAWHERPDALARLCPPWDPVTLKYSDGHIKEGARVKLQVKGPLKIPVNIEVVHEEYEEGVQFQDRQISGPFAHWVHTHAVTSHSSEQEATLTDQIHYKLPFSPLGDWLGGRMVRHRLEQLFHYRHSVLQHDFRLHQLARGQTLHFAVSGSTGLVGSALCALLKTGGHRVTRLTRAPAPDSRIWDDPEDVPDLSDIDIVIHLAGESVAQRWSRRKKQAILESRTRRTKALAKALAESKTSGSGPHTFICASAIGYYGDQGSSEAWVDETSPQGSGFLADVCDQWELACQPARSAGIRVVNARIGIVLSPEGGALEKLLLPFLLGAGGPIGSGRPYMSWISLHDVIGALYFCALIPEIEGPVNLVSPEPVTNKTFSQSLGSVLKRPAFLPLPALALKLIFGEMASETMLSGQRVRAGQLIKYNYPFIHTTLETALRFELGRVDFSTHMTSSTHSQIH